MKTNVLKTSAIVAIFLIALSANELKAQTSIGVKGGYTAASLRGDDAGDIEWKNGFAGGLFVNFAIFKAFTIQPEVLFRQRGGYNHSQTFNIDQNIRLSYMDVPVLFKLRLPIDNTFYPHVYIGPQFSYNISGKYDVEAFDQVTVERELEVKKVDVGGVMGFGLDITSNKFFFTTDFRYGLGAINIDNSDDPYLLKNKDLSIMVGVGVNIGGK